MFGTDFWGGYRLTLGVSRIDTDMRILSRGEPLGTAAAAWRKPVFWLSMRRGARVCERDTTRHDESSRDSHGRRKKPGRSRYRFRFDQGLPSQRHQEGHRPVALRLRP